MTSTVLERWHQLVIDRNRSGLDALLSERAIFYSPIVHAPQVGKAITAQYLMAAFQVFFNESFRYVQQTVGSQHAVLEFEVQIDGIGVNGVDMISWDDEDKIIAFKVMIRPLKAIQLIHQKMAAMLQAQQ